ncbi:MAG: TonB-dependent receptor [Pseudomonadales bacterium]
MNLRFWKASQNGELCPALSAPLKLGAISLALFAGLSTQQAVAQEEEQMIEELVVTGSRITRSNLTSPTPLQVLSSEDIDLGAETNIGEFLNQLPALGTPDFNRTNSNFDINNSGVVNINLRNLGIERTLTLVNGRRFVAGVPGNSAVDLNAIPTAMIERVELISGGASAVYGSDAVSGVVNLILKDDFEGVDVTTRFEQTGENDGEEADLGLLIGSNFADGRGNSTIYFGYTEQKGVFSRDRKRTELDAVAPIALGITDDADVDRGSAVFGQVFPFFSSFPPQGRFDVNGTGASGDDYTYLPDGTLVDSFFTNGSTAAGRGPDGFNRMAFRTIAIPTERYLLATNTHYDFNENLSLFLEGTYTTTDTVAELEPFPLASDDLFQTSISGGIPLMVQDSSGAMIQNPLIPSVIASDALANGVDGVFFTRRLAEFGPRGATNERQTFRIATGFEGTIDPLGWHWDMSYVRGQTTQSQISQGQTDNQAFTNALLVEPDPANAGSLRCISAEARANGCAPANVFGFNSISPEAIAYITADQSRNAKITQTVWQANLTGDVFELPAGPLQFAVGAEYREEKSEAINDALTVRGLNSSNAAPSVTGKFDVTEGYLELNAPILADNVVDYFGIGGAVRFSDYSTVGNTTAWEGRFELAPIDQVMLRGSISRAVRAPNVDELFDPGTQTFAQVNDPCAGVTATTPGTTAANCRSIPAIAARIAATGAFTLTQPELQGTSGFLGGNPDLAEEKADTWTVGIVYTPNFLPEGLDVSTTVDWFDIEIEDAIFTVTQNNVLDLCYSDPAFPNNPLCGNIVRFPSGLPQQGALDEVNSGTANVGSIVGAGLDWALNIDFEPNAFGIGLPGLFSLNTIYTYLDESYIVNLPGGAPDNERGEIGDPKHRWNANLRYTNGNLLMQWQLRYIGKGALEDTDLTKQDCIDLAIDCVTGAETYSDIQVRYTIPQRFASGELELFGGVENLFDNEPPIVSAGLSDSDTGAETVAGVYDAIGRAYYLGAKLRF